MSSSWLYRLSDDTTHILTSGNRRLRVSSTSASTFDL
jgi:hypothetical protein